MPIKKTNFAANFRNELSNSCINVKKHITTAVKVLIFLTIGVLLFWLAYRGQDFSRIMEAVGEARWLWVALALLLSVAGHYSRALRWRLLLEPFGYRPRNLNLFCSVMVMYLSNMAIPRSGEVVRCGIVTKYENIPFARCLGTVVTERIADMIVLLILTVVILFTQGDVATGIMDSNPWIGEGLQKLGGYVPHLVIGGLMLCALAFFAVRMAIRRDIMGLGTKITTLLKNFKDGLLTILKLKKRWQFLFHSLFINFVYFYTIYLVFKAFAFSEELSLMVALTLFVFSTFGVVIPSPGGIGTWHFIVIEVLGIYGVRKDPDAGAYALVMHGIQDILFIIVGFASLMLMPVLNNNYQPYQPDENTENS